MAALDLRPMQVQMPLLLVSMWSGQTTSLWWFTMTMPPTFWNLRKLPSAFTLNVWQPMVWSLTLMRARVNFSSCSEGLARGPYGVTFLDSLTQPLWSLPRASTPSKWGWLTSTNIWGISYMPMVTYFLNFVFALGQPIRLFNNIAGQSTTTATSAMPTGSKSSRPASFLWPIGTVLHGLLCGPVRRGIILELSNGWFEDSFSPSSHLTRCSLGLTNGPLWRLDFFRPSCTSGSVAWATSPLWSGMDLRHFGPCWLQTAFGWTKSWWTCLGSPHTAIAESTGPLSWAQMARSTGSTWSRSTTAPGKACSRKLANMLSCSPRSTLERTSLNERLQPFWPTTILCWPHVIRPHLYAQMLHSPQCASPASAHLSARQHGPFMPSRFMEDEQQHATLQINAHVTYVTTPSWTSIACTCISDIASLALMH